MHYPSHRLSKIGQIEKETVRCPYYAFFDVPHNAYIVFTFFVLIFEPVHEISNNVVCATSKASDQPVHTRSLIRAFASHLSIL